MSAAPLRAGADATLLAIETATRVMSVAVQRGDTLLAEITTDDARVHSERLLPAVDQALALAGLPLAGIDAFAVSVGPGSFTGLRIGLATVKAFAMGGARPVAAVATLRALANGAVGCTGPVAALLDARRGEAYGAVYADAGLGASETAVTVGEGVYTPETLAPKLPEGSALLGGEGAAPFVERLLALRSDCRALPESAGVARASRVAAVGLRLLRDGHGVSADALVPRYVRRAEAEARRTGQPTEPRAL